jgi:D-3-phosphoglycerate dehydrogenase
MKVLAYEPVPDHAFCSQWHVELVELDDLFRRSDYVTLHAPGEAGNQALVNAERLALMKPSAVLINTARGVLVDEDALYAALHQGTLAGAGLDVRVHEPPVDNRFEGLTNVVLTPHAAGSTQEAQAVSAEMVVRSVLQAASGEPPHGLLNAEVWDRRRSV